MFRGGDPAKEQRAPARYENNNTALQSESLRESTTSTRHGVVSPRLEATYAEDSTRPKTMADDMFSVGCMLAQLYLPGNAPLFTRRSLTQFRVLCRKRVYQKLEEATARQNRRAKAKGRASKDQFTSPRGAAALAR